MLYDFSGDQLCISTAIVPSLDQILFVGINQRLILTMKTCPCWRLSHLQVKIHALAADANLSGNVRRISFLGKKSMYLGTVLLALYGIGRSFPAFRLLNAVPAYQGPSWEASFQGDQDGSVGSPLTKREIIDAQNSWCRELTILLCAHESKQGIRTG